jgi:hypothetical protein
VNACLETAAATAGLATADLCADADAAACTAFDTLCDCTDACVTEKIAKGT